MKVLVDFGSVDLKKMSEMQMQENTYFVGFKVGFFLLEMDFSGSSWFSGGLTTVDGGDIGGDGSIFSLWKNGTLVYHFDLNFYFIFLQLILVFLFLMLFLL